MSLHEAVRTPDRPGPGPIADALVRSLELKVRGRITGVLSGDHRSAMTGSGTELQTIREYVPGDDVRWIDWNATARTNTAQVKTHVAERALTTWLLLDTSPSMAFGTTIRRKADVAEGVARVFGRVATRRNNRLGFVTFGGSQRRSAPARQGRAGLVELLTALAATDPSATFTGVPAHQHHKGRGALGDAESLTEALHIVANLQRSRSIIVIVSDFRDNDNSWLQPLREATARHDVIVCEIGDPRENELPNVGELTLIDPETGAQLRVDTSSRKIRERFAQAATADRSDLRLQIEAAHADHLVLQTGDDWLRSLAGFLETRSEIRK